MVVREAEGGGEKKWGKKFGNTGFKPCAGISQL